MHLSGAQIIAAERTRQLGKGYGPERDAEYVDGELALAAAHYAAPGLLVHEDGGAPAYPFLAPDKKGDCDRIHQLAVAGAFVAAELDRLIAEARPDGHAFQNDVDPLTHPDQCSHWAPPETDSDGVTCYMRRCGYPASAHLPRPLTSGAPEQS